MVGKLYITEIVKTKKEYLGLPKQRLWLARGEGLVNDAAVPWIWELVPCREMEQLVNILRIMEACFFHSCRRELQIRKGKKLE